MVRWRLTPTVTTLEFAARPSRLRALAAGVTVPVHVKVDTGEWDASAFLPEEVVPFARAAPPLPGLPWRGTFTHFCTADSADPSYMLISSSGGSWAC